MRITMKVQFFKIDIFKLVSYVVLLRKELMDLVTYLYLVAKHFNFYLLYKANRTENPWLTKFKILKFNLFFDQIVHVELFKMNPYHFMCTNWRLACHYICSHLTIHISWYHVVYIHVYTCKYFHILENSETWNRKHK